MKKARLALGLSCLVSISLLARADEEKSAHRPYPSPRKSGEGRASFTSNNVQLLSWLTLADLSVGATSGNDSWGYTSGSGREYALIGTSDGTAFVEVTDPGSAQLVQFIAGPNSLWRDIKTYGTHAYAVSEGGGGIQIFDLLNIDAGTVTLANTIATGGCTTASHNVVIDTTSGFLYRCGGGGSPCPGGLPQGLAIYNIGANATNPPFAGLYSARYVHDCQVVVSTRPGALNGAQLAFCAADDGSGGGTANLHILNVTNKAAITTVTTAAYTSNAFSHQIWLTPDQRYAYLNDELDEETFGFNTRTRIFDVSNPATPVFLGFFSSGTTAIDHNLYVTSNKIFEANYRSGLRVFDNTVPTAPSVYGFFDTYEADDIADFNGMWSNYPFFPSGTVIGSDIEKGLFVFRLGAAKLTFAFPGGAPQFVPPTGGPVQFEVNENAPGDLDTGTVQFHYSVNGGSFSVAGASSLGGNLYQASLPAGSCGDAVEYYISAMSSDGTTWRDPQSAPTQVYQATAAYGEIVAHTDDFETNTGWLVNQAADLTGFTTATTGTWTRVNPVGTAAQPEDDHTDAPGVFCFVTGQGTVGGGLGDQDIDGGATSLRSPVLNASGLSDPHLSYWRWFSNNQNGVVDDVMTVDISNNGGSSWVNVETLGPVDSDSVGGWIKHDLRIADFVSPTSNMRLRFRASDLGSGSIVEAGVDDLTIRDFDCTPPSVTVTSISQASGPFEGGNIVTLTGTGFNAGTTVSFGANAAAAVNVLDANTLNVRVPSAKGALSGKLRAAKTTVDVIVSNPGSDSLPNAYTYLLPQK